MTAVTDQRKQAVRDLLKERGYPQTAEEINEKLTEHGIGFSGSRANSTCIKFLKLMLEEGLLCEHSEEGRRESIWYVENNIFLKPFITRDLISLTLCKNALTLGDQKTITGAKARIMRDLRNNPELAAEVLDIAGNLNKRIRTDMVKMRFFATKLSEIAAATA